MIKYQYHNSMKLIYFLIVTCLVIPCTGQDMYSGIKGPRLFPGHMHVIISVDSNVVHYQLFNHWYTRSYAQYRDIVIPIDDLDNFNSENDTLAIVLHDNKIKLKDERNGLNMNIKHKKLCSQNPDQMRKISYAYSLSEKHEDIRHFDLYEEEDLESTEADFKERVNQTLEQLLRAETAEQKE